MEGIPHCLPNHALHVHVIRVGDVLPPIVMNSILTTFCSGEMFHPPEVMSASITMAPFCSSDRAFEALKVGEVVEPVIRFAQHRGSIAPVIVTFAVWRKMD